MKRAVFVLLAVAIMVTAAGAVQAAEPPKEPILRIETGMHTAIIYRISVDAENRLLATASQDKTVRLWNARTGELIRIIRPPVGEGDEGKLYAVALTPDGKMAAVGGWTGYEWDRVGNIYLFDSGTGLLLRRLTGLPNVITHLAFSRDGRHLAAGLGQNNGIRIYRTDDFTVAGEDKDYGSDSKGAAFDPAGGLVTTSYDGYLRRYDASFHLTAKVNAPGGKQPYAIAFSPDGRSVAVGFEDTTAVNVLDGSELKFLFAPDTQGVGNGNLGRVAWSADGRRLYAGGRYQKQFDGIWKYPIRTWSDGGRGGYADIPAANNTIMDLQPRKGGGVFFGAGGPDFGALDGQGKSLYTRNPGIADYRNNPDGFKASPDGAVIHFAYEVFGKSPAVFALTERRLSTGAAIPAGIALAAPRTDAPGLTVTDWKNTYTPKLNGAPLKLMQYEMSRSLAIAPSGRTFLLGAELLLRLFNAAGGEIWRAPVPEVPWAVNITDDGRYALAAFGDGTIRWYSMTDGREMLAFFPHKDRKRWVMWTPEGFFDASDGGAQLIGYHLNQGKDSAAKFVEVDKLYDQFYRPDLVLAKFQGKDITEYAKSADVKSLLTTETLPPTVLLTTAAGSRQKRDTEIAGEICDQGGGIGDVTLYLNDMPVVLDKGGRALKVVAKSSGKDCRGFAHTVTLTEGENIIGLMARNKANTIESNRAGVTLAFRSGQKERPDLYVLAVAVNKYRDGDLRLKYPIPDADDLVKSIRKGGKRLFGKVIVKTVYDDAATSEGLELAFQEMGKQTKRDDVFILFLAGHGITYDKDGNYYFLPVDFRYTGDEAIRKQGVSKDDLMKNLTYIQAMKSLLLLDTCNSGSFAEAVASRNIVEKTAINRLSRATGRSTIVASSRDQAALEGYEGHGVFTYTILQGMGGAAKDREGKVTVSGLATYIEETLPKLTFKKWGYEQIPQKSLQGMDFPLSLE